MLKKNLFPASKTFFIGEAAQKAGVTVKAIRFYERSGLIPKTGRNPGNFRILSEENIQRIVFIKRAQALGFSLEEIAEILAVYDQGNCSCGQVRESVEQKLTMLDKKLSELKSLKKELLVVKKRLDNQESERSTTICPVIHQSQRSLKG